MTNVKFPLHGLATAPKHAEPTADPFLDAAEVVRANIRELNCLFHTGSESITVAIDNASLRASVALEAMRDIADALPPNHKRDSAYEIIGGLSGQLSRRLEKLAKDLSKMKSAQTFHKLDVLFAIKRGTPIPTVPGNDTIH